MLDNRLSLLIQDIISDKIIYTPEFKHVLKFNEN